MKPFDLAAAKAGNPIQTRDGKPVKFITHVPEAKPTNRVVCLVNNEIHGFAENGSPFENDKSLADYGQGSGYSWDLFMVPKTQTIWINFYDCEKGLYGGSRISEWPSKYSADAHAGKNRIACKQIIIEEGEGL